MHCNTILLFAAVLQDAHKNYTRTAKELNKARSSYAELETMVSKLRTGLESTASSQSKDRNRIQELSDEVRVWIFYCYCTARIM
jgi:septation ring formation regulator EzrA